MPEAILFGGAKLARLSGSTAELGDTDLVELLFNVFAHAHVLAESEGHAGLHNTIYCGEAAFHEISGRWIPPGVVYDAAEQFNRDEQADDAR